MAPILFNNNVSRMKGDWLAILLLAVLLGLMMQAVEAPVILWTIKTIGSWFAAIPGPDQHFAEILGDWAWPGAALVIAWWLREHISSAASALARRFEKDNLQLGGWLRLEADTSLSTLDERVASEAPNTVEAEDAKLVESLLEYAADSEANAERLEGWIWANFGPTFDPEEFLSEDRFVEHRKRAYTELVKGDADG